MSSIQREDYLELFEEKKSLFIREFTEKTPIDFFKSPDKAYRYRAEFGLLKKKDEYFYSMTKNGEKVAINSFPISSQKIQSIMPLLLIKIQSNSIISHKLFQIEFQSSRNNEAMVSLIYHKELGDEWFELASNISDELDISIPHKVIADKVKDVMENAVDLKIPNKVDYESGPNWGSIK